MLRTKLAPGMILEVGAVDRDGRMLIGPETVLTDRLIKVIDNAQIPILYVTDESWETHKTCPELPPLPEAQEENLRDRFMHVDLDGPFARAVYDECMNMAREDAVSAAEPTEDGAAREATP
ncbi:MAG: hypothetical protein QF570_15735 [Myxococcota bacterium]|nr:hypothetical protein [Myxococcota bacterium]